MELQGLSYSHRIILFAKFDIVSQRWKLTENYLVIIIIEAS